MPTNHSSTAGLNTLNRKLTWIPLWPCHFSFLVAILVSKTVSFNWLRLLHRHVSRCCSYFCFR